MEAYVRKKSNEKYRRKLRISFPGVCIYVHADCKAVKLAVRLGTVFS